MQKYFDINAAGLSIRCKLYFNKDIHAIRRVVIATYGYGGNKDNKAVEKFAERITTKYKGYGVICFDWPCHGNDARNRLIMDETLTYLEMVTAYAREEMKAEKVYNYSSSFGAYITLRYLHEKGNIFDRIAFRCPAIRMYDAIVAGRTQVELEKIARGKEVLSGYDRKIKLTQDLLDDLKEHDVTQYEYLDYADDILMIHGTKDSMVPFAWAKEFAENNVIELLPVENCDHPFSNVGDMDFAIQKIIEWFK